MTEIRVFNTHSRFRVRVQETKLFARRVLRKARVTRGELNIVVMNDRDMVKLNGEHLGHWYTTDVVSFPLEKSRKGYIDGEVYVNIDQARRQAKEYGVTIRNEVSRLVVHGILHLLGHDDRTGKQKLQMTKLENRYLQLLTKE
jgi:probable rRNA maturation factor